MSASSESDSIDEMEYNRVFYGCYLDSKRLHWRCFGFYKRRKADEFCFDKMDKNEALMTKLVSLHTYTPLVLHRFFVNRELKLGTTMNE